MERIFTFAGLLLLFVNGYTQVVSDNNPLFDDSEVARIDITINPAHLQTILQPGNEESYTEYPATFSITSSKFTAVVENVGFRLRGNTSRYAKKKSFKVSFNTFEPGKKLKGIEKLNLNGEHNDPSIIRSKLVWDLMNGIGLPAPRANHVRLYINNQYYGLYINVEHIDENFVKTRFGNNNGNLYKCLYPADLTYRSADPNAYKFVQNGYRVYDLKTNTEQDNYTDIAQLIDVVNRTPVSELPAKLEPIFDVNNFLKYLAAEALTGNWDGYSYNRNNFYLYKNTITGRFEFIPYDADNTFGIDWFNIDWATRSVNSWASSQARPLTKNILAVDAYRKRYYFYLKQLINGLFSTNTIQSKALALRSKIETYAASDPYRSLDYGWSSSDFYSSYFTALGGHVKYGLVSFVSKRIQYANAQFSVDNIPPIVSNVSWLAYGYKIPVTIFADVDDEEKAYLKLHFKAGEGNWQIIDMQNTNRNHYKATIGPWDKPVKHISIYLEATDNTGKTTREPLYNEYTVEFNEIAIPLCINEVMTSNTSIFPDEFGNYSDWIELYNYGVNSVSLQGMSISDTLGKPGKWALPDITISPGAFIVLWADGQPEKGKNHLPFRLNHDGEEIGLFTSKTDGYKLIDGFRFNLFPKNASFGYYPNAVGLPQVLLSPTPGMSNVKTSTQVDMVLPEIIAYPNPFTQTLIIRLSYRPAYDYTISAINSQGITVWEQHVKKDEFTNLEWCPQNLSKGIYLIAVTVHGKQNQIIQTQKVIFEKF
ncbi:MAG: CotH kinase family protein [Bacteroidota bacterium]